MDSQPTWRLDSPTYRQRDLSSGTMLKIPHWSIAKWSSPNTCNITYRRQTGCLSVPRPLESVARLGDGGIGLCLSVVIVISEYHIIIMTTDAHLLCRDSRDNQTDCDKRGEYPCRRFATASELLWPMLHVMETRTHHPIYNVTVVLKRPHVSVVRLSDNGAIGPEWNGNLGHYHFHIAALFRGQNQPVDQVTAAALLKYGQNYT